MFAKYPNTCRTVLLNMNTHTCTYHNIKEISNIKRILYNVYFNKDNLKTKIIDN